MEAWLTFPARLLMVALVGFFVWTVVSDSLRPIKTAVSGKPAAQSVESHEDAASDSAMIVAVLVAVAAASLAYVTIEIVRFSRFRHAIAEVIKLGGSIRFSPQTESELLSFVFGSATVDLSEAIVPEDRVPRFSAITNLRSLRLAEARFPKTLLHEISRTRSLVSLDLTATGLTDDDLAHFIKLRNLKNLLLSNNEVSEQAVQNLATTNQVENVVLH